MLSPPGSGEVLLKSKMRPRFAEGETVVLVGAGKHTANVQEIRERFKALKIKVDWKRLQNVLDIRNDIEHYRTESDPSRILELIAGVVPILQQFMTEYLGLQPRETLGPEIWGLLNENAKVFELQLRVCENALDAALGEGPSRRLLPDELSCPDCSSRLLRPAGEVRSAGIETLLECVACGCEASYASIAEEQIEEHFWWERHLAAKEGGDEPIFECNECGRNSFSVEDGLCLVCGEEPAYATCSLCGTSLTPDEQDLDGYCSRHYHLMNKDD